MTTKVSTDVIQSSAITNDKITSLATTKLTGTINNEQIASVATSKLTGTISNAQLAGSITNDKITSLAASKLTGALPAIDGSNLTGVEADIFAGATYQNQTGVARGTNYTNNYGKTIYIKARGDNDENSQQFLVGGVEIDSIYGTGWFGGIVPPGAVWRINSNANGVNFTVKILR